MKNISFFPSIVCLIITNLFSACVIPPATAENLAKTSVATQVYNSSRLDAAYLWFGEFSDAFHIGGVEKMVGSVANITLNITPATFMRKPNSEGWLLDRRNTDSNLTETRYCFSIDKTCELPELWEPVDSFIPSGQLPYKTVKKITVDWEGMRTVYLKVQIRDDEKNIVPAGILEDNFYVFHEIAELSFGVRGRKPTPTPNVIQTQTSAAATLAALPVRGSIRFENSPIGGKAGSTITAAALFEATSPYGKVTEMRETGRMLAGETEIEAPWEPFVSRKEYQINVIINWTTFYRCVEFRDEKGNRSPFYCADVGVEGNP